MWEPTNPSLRKKIPQQRPKIRILIYYLNLQSLPHILIYVNKCNVKKTTTKKIEFRFQIADALMHWSVIFQNLDHILATVVTLHSDRRNSTFVNNKYMNQQKIMK